jgi:aspartyl-tRNA(Asn)/glutamyl-tRNA(Gln) amidotransferase subunit C
MAVSRQDVEKAALLGRLLVSPDELEHLTAQVADILAYVEQLGEVDTADVEPMAHAVELVNVFREDAVKPSLPRDAALANAPHHNEQGFLVPAVLGD